MDREYYHQQFPGLEDKVDTLLDSTDPQIIKAGKFVLETEDFEHFRLVGYAELADNIAYPIQRGRHARDRIALYPPSYEFPDDAA